MYRSLALALTLFFASASAFAETTSDDSKITQALLLEIRQLRHDLQSAASTIQRVQVVMHRVQVETGPLSRAAERLDQVRARCSQVRAQRKYWTDEIEQAEVKQRNAQNQADKKSADDVLRRFKASAEISATEEQECQVEQADAENQFRIEQAKMNDFQEQLDRLDKALAALAAR